MEEWLPRWAHNPKAAGSSPAPATKLCDCLIVIKKLYKLNYPINFNNKYNV